MGENLLAIRGALELLGSSQKNAKKTSNTVPTAKTRAALDLLVNSTPEKLISDQVNLRELTSNLFDWAGEPKATKNLMRALSNALNTPGKYSHAVELAAYLAALAPLFQPDRLVRLFGAIDEVNTAFAPARFTLQLSHKLKRLLEQYPEERREKLAYSLWVQSHGGRWWDLTAGQDVDVVEPDNTMSKQEMLDLFEQYKLTWSPATAARFTQIDEHDSIRDVLEKYNDELLDEKILDPDVAVLASHLDWLAPFERPESPVGSLLDTLHGIIAEIDYDMPEKPKSFSEMFPNIQLYDSNMFPFPNAIYQCDGRMLIPNVRMELVSTATVLADNRTYMGNCTWSYKSRMEKGEYVLFRIHDGEHIYNGSMILNGNTWRLGEINSRHNRGQVPTAVRNAFNRFIDELPPAVADNDLTRKQEAYEKLRDFTNHKYRYKIS